MSAILEEATHAVHGETKCRDCGAVLKYAPGTTSLKCEYCGAANQIAQADATAVAAATAEIDFDKFISEKAGKEEQQQVSTVKCSACGATTSLKPNVTSDHCPFCATPLVVTGGATSTVLKPKAMLPFKIEQKDAVQRFRGWLKGLWFAPNDLKRYARQDGRLDGLYIPYWTYDSKTASVYTGERGVNYQVSETYTTTENGKTVTKTRQVTKIRWSPVAGNVSNNFDDVLVVASNSLPKDKARALEPWDLKALVPFNENYLTGYRTESYQVDVKQGMDVAKKIMAETIESAIRRDIGGDHQKIHSVNTRYWDVTFKHVLLPIWISAYRYHAKVYRFLVNARTGEVQGERPWSWAKIALAVVAVLGTIGLIAHFSQ